MGFIDTIKARARERGKTIVLAESSDARTLQAASAILQDNISKVVLLGDRDEIFSNARNLGVKCEILESAHIIAPEKSEYLEDFISDFVALRAKKGMTAEKARELLSHNPLYFGAALVRSGKADGMVAGAINATADVLRAGLQIIGVAQGTKIVSSFFVMIVPNSPFGLQYEGNGIFLFADCALMQYPNSDELAQIALSAANSFTQIIGETPKIALLSHSTRGSASHERIDVVREALKIIRDSAPHLQVDGEMQLDAAIVPSVGKSKAPDSAIAGGANVLVFPNIDAGNIGYKLVQRLAKAEAYGPITQGMAKPINDLSRGCSAEDIVGAVALTALQAN